jgi:D-sedoheptulose 7-phosphate isomerase
MIREHFLDSIATMAASAEDSGLLTAITDAAERITKSLSEGKKLLLAGNGGSAGDAQHIAGEFLSRLNFDRPPLAAIALSVDTSVITAIGNDYGFDKIFQRQVSALGIEGDIFIAISTSGRSPNIINAMKTAQDKGLVVIGLTGQAGGDMVRLSDVCLKVPSNRTPMIQQVHITIAHIICGLVERNLYGEEDER